MRPRPQVAMATRATPNWKVDFAMGPENTRAHMRGADYRSHLDSPKGSKAPEGTIRRTVVANTLDRSAVGRKTI